MRIVLACNSQGTDLGVAPESAYPMLVRDALEGEHDVDIVAESGWTIDDFNRNLERVLASEPNLVVLQVGIVECARRILSPFEKRIIYRLPGGTRFSKFLHDRRAKAILVRNRLQIDTRLYTFARFERSLARFAASVGQASAELLALRIPSFNPAYERKHFPLINDDIALFNRALAQFGARPLFTADDDDHGIWQPGTVHFNEDGHRLAAARLVEAVRAAVPVSSR